MNQSLLLHIVERLEGLLGKLPAGIQKPILSELTPLKELFLQQRPPRLVLTGSSKWPLQEILPALFDYSRAENYRNLLMEVFHWQDIDVQEHGTLSVLDTRDVDETAMPKIQDELRRQRADLFLFLDDASSSRAPRKRDVDNLAALLAGNDQAQNVTKVIGIAFRNDSARKSQAQAADRQAKFQAALSANATVRDRLVQVNEVIFPAENGESGSAFGSHQLMELITHHLPNEARVEMVRISRNREAQAEIAQILVKSTTAICTAVGTQPIPLADLPVLTTLQLVMVSGIMYISGRERNLRAATEFLGALGANVGAGMILREGTRAVLKFFPGWGNVVCGMVAGAGTYALGRASTVYFLEGVSLKDARRIYLSNRRKRPRPAITSRKGSGRTTKV